MPVLSDRAHQGPPRLHRESGRVWRIRSDPRIAARILYRQNLADRVNIKYANGDDGYDIISREALGVSRDTPQLHFISDAAVSRVKRPCRVQQVPCCIVLCSRLQHGEE